MQRLGQDMRSHPLATAIFLILWLGLWGITAVTWQYDADGSSVGMYPLAFGLHFALPLGAGALLGWWREILSRKLRGGAFAGCLCCAVDMVLLLAWSGILIWRGLAQPGAEAMPWWEGWLEVLHLGLTYVLIGALLGLVGAAASALVTAVSQRREGS